MLLKIVVEYKTKEGAPLFKSFQRKKGAKRKRKRQSEREWGKKRWIERQIDR